MPRPVKAGAVILAAGLSSRFEGRLKALAEVEGRSLLALASGVFRGCGLNEILVVTGHRHAEVETEAAALGLDCVFNPDYAHGMLSSAQAGLKRLDERIEAFFILPVDCALVSPLTALKLLSAWRLKAGQKKPGIFIPVFNSRCGHPPLISNEYREDILRGGDLSLNQAKARGESPESRGPGIDAPPGFWDGSGGLRGWLASKLTNGQADFLQGLRPLASGKTIDFLELEDENIVCDIDTPEDLASAKLNKAKTAPNINEAWHLLLQSDLSAAKIRHHLKVALSALRLTLALRSIGENEADPHLSLMAALVHDLARKEQNHALAGRRRLEAMGWQDEALVVGSHTDLPAVFLKGLGLDYCRTTDDAQYIQAERRIRLSALAVYLADKYWWNDEPAALGERFAISRRHAEAKDICAKIIDKREMTAQALENWFRRRLGSEPETVARQISGDEREAQLAALAKEA